MWERLVALLACAVVAVVLAASAGETEAKSADASLVVVDWASSSGSASGVISPPSPLSPSTTTSTQRRQQRHHNYHLRLNRGSGEPPSLVSHWLDFALGSCQEESSFYGGGSSSSSSSRSSRSRSSRSHDHKRGNSSDPSSGGGGGGGSGGSGGGGKPKDDDDAHKHLLPLLPRDYFGLVAASFAILLASGSGIGGGGLLVPIYLLVFGFGTRDSVALSNLTILGSAVVSLFFNLPRRHPRHADRPLIDWDIILVMEPSTICGAVVGGYLNKITPTWLTTTFLALLLAAMATKLVRRSRSIWTLESEERRLARLAAEQGRERISGLSALLLQEEESVFGPAASLEEPLVLPGETLSSSPSLPSLVSLADEAARSPPPKPPPRRRGFFGNGNGNGGSSSPGSSPPKPSLARGEDEERPSANSSPSRPNGAEEESAGAAAGTAETTPSPFSEPRAAPPLKVALIFSLTLFVLAADLAKQLVPCGSPYYWLSVASVIPPSLAVALVARARLVREHALRESGAPGWPAYEPGEVVWTSANSISFPAISTLAGVVAGFFGVGGGIVKGPLMLEMGVAPEVAAATSITMILFTSSAASVLYISFGVPEDYAKAVFVTGAVFTALGQSLVTRLIRRLDRSGRPGGGAGVVVVAMAAMMAASASVVTFEAGALARRAFLTGTLGRHGHICSK